jgi:hypothetical protein
MAESKFNIPPSDQDLAVRLVKVPDAEIQAYHKQRVRKARYYYLAGGLCGIGVIVFAIYQLTVPAIIITVIGLFLVQSGRYQREKWLKLYHYLTYLRTQQMKKNQEKHEQEKSGPGQKYRISHK